VSTIIGTTVHDHWNTHLALSKAKEAEEVAYGDDLLAQIKQLNTRTIRILDAAEAAGDPRIALAAIREVRGNTELLCRIVAAMEANRPSFPCDEGAVTRLAGILFGGGQNHELEAIAISSDESVKCPACTERSDGLAPNSSSNALRETISRRRLAEAATELAAKPGESHNAWVQRMVRISQEEAML